MQGRIPQDKIEEIRDRADIVSVIGEYTALKKAGASYKGLCPFHSEKTPSFHVHPDRGFFHCFGCKESGDVFSFVSKIEGGNFFEAVSSLAERTGVELPKVGQAISQSQDEKREKEQSFKLMEAATVFFEEQLLNNSSGKAAQIEIESRGILPEFSKQFRLGYAPDSWDALIQHLQNQKADLRLAEKLGLITPKKSGRGWYDRFRHRLMFPIADQRGRVIAFSGRALANETAEQTGSNKAIVTAKYINSPETPLYTKGKTLYGLHHAKALMRKEGFAIVCEGNFDLIALHQAELAQTVAPMGTALTEDQARLIRRQTEQVIVLFDGDVAGQKATFASHAIWQSVGIQARVAVLGDGNDPDSFLRDYGIEALKQKITSAAGIVEYFIDELSNAAAAHPNKKAQAISKLGPIVAQIKNPVEKQLYIEKIAQKFGIRDLNILKRELRSRVTKPKKPGNPDSNRVEENPIEKKVTAHPLEIQLAGALLDVPELITYEGFEDENPFQSPELKKLFLTLQSLPHELLARKNIQVFTKKLLDEMEKSPIVDWIKRRLASVELENEEAAKVIKNSLPRLQRRVMELRLAELRQRIIEARKNGLSEKAEELSKERHALFQSATKLGYGIGATQNESR